MGLFSFIGSAIGGILGLGGSKTTASTTQADFSKQFESFQKEVTTQMNLQAKESKNTLTMVLAGAGFLIVIMFFFLKK